MKRVLTFALVVALFGAGIYYIDRSGIFRDYEMPANG